MQKITVKNAAKINLALDVTGKLPNGYHTIESVFQTVGLYDTVTVELADSISVNCIVPPAFAKSDRIPCDERNIAFKAAKLFFSNIGSNGGCRISISKGIPSQAGMGGGSSDAAAVLYCLNKLTGSTIPAERLAVIAAKLGADVPFFLNGGTAFVGGFGEKITPIADYSGKILVIAKGTEGVSTAEAYGNVDNLTAAVHPDAKRLADAINSGESNAWEYFGNIFEEAVSLPEVTDIKTKMNESGALSAVMSGSGSAVFGLFSNIASAQNCSQLLTSCGYFAQLCTTVPDSVIEI